MKTDIMLIGGFLGAGKTTVLWKIAERLSLKGQKVGLITNDQASELVDTAFLTSAKGVVAEVSGSCFCCNFNGFTEAIEHVIKENQVETVVAEPVGSCTDLSATLLQPLKDKWRQQLIVRPLSVLVDPVRLREILNDAPSQLHDSAAYIIKKQLEEADFIVMNKMDLLSETDKIHLVEQASHKWKQAKVYAISALTGENVYEWLEAVLMGTQAGTHLAQVDYEIYAEGEAVLGWLNATIGLESGNTDWNAYAKSLLENLKQQFEQDQAAVGHVKLMNQNKEAFVLGNITGTDSDLNIRGHVDTEEKVQLTLNARVEMTPERLEEIVRTAIQLTCGDNIGHEIQVLKCLQPGTPHPTFRYEEVVASSY